MNSTIMYFVRVSSGWDEDCRPRELGEAGIFERHVLRCKPSRLQHEKHENRSCGGVREEPDAGVKLAPPVSICEP